MFIKFADGLVNTDHIIVGCKIDRDKFCVYLRLSSDDNLVEEFESSDNRDRRFDKICKILSEK